MTLIGQIKDLINRVENADHWITIGADEETGKKGTHILVKDGESHKEATERKIAEWKGNKEETKQPAETPKEGKKEKESSSIETQKQAKEESPFGEGVEITEHNKKGYMVDSKNLKSYRKGDKYTIVDDWSHEGKDRFTVHFYNGKKQLESKTYSTKRGMEKAIREHLQGGANKETKALETKTDLETAKTNYKEVLKKYNEADRKRWKQDISDADYHKAWEDYEKYKKELTTARREYAESIMSNFEKVEDNPYEERQAARRERYEELSDKASKQSDVYSKQSHDMISAIPMGQPILVGHHSEMRDRRYRERAWDKMDKAYQLSKKSDYYADRAASVGKAGISSDDANAIAKLAEKYKSGVTSAEKRRIIDRVIDIHTRSTEVKDTPDTSHLGFEVERNTNLNRLQLKFDGKPDEKTRSILKSNGFRWSPREGAWQRQLNGNAEYGLKRVTEAMTANNALDEIILDSLAEIILEQ